MEITADYFRNLNEIKNSCEKLITETQCDIEIFRNEQQQLQKQIQGIVEEKPPINSKKGVFKSGTTSTPPFTIKKSGDSKDDASREKLTNEAFQNVKKQNDYLQRENKDLRLLNKNHQKNIENLEHEIQNYRNQLFKSTSVCEVKHKYATAIKILETTIAHKNVELEEQSQKIKILCDQKKHLNDRVEKSQKKLEEKLEEVEKLAEKKEIINKLEKQLAETERHNKELKKSLETSRQAIEQRFKREQSALQKVQYALSLAEAAVADKEEAVKREKVLREECDNIATTIGQVMDEASRKVESDIEEIKKSYIEKEKSLVDENTKFKQDAENQKNFIQILETRCKRFQMKYNDAVEENNNLSGQKAKILCDLEGLKKNIEHKNNDEPLEQSSNDEHIQVQQFLESNRLIIGRYNTTITDLIQKFEEKIYNLQDEVNKLKVENQGYKLQKNP